MLDINEVTGIVDERLVSLNYITEHSGLTKSWFYALIKTGAFPGPIKLGRASRWWLSEYMKWLREQEKRSRAV